MKIGQKVIIRQNKSGMNLTLVDRMVKVIDIEQDAFGPFYTGIDEKNKRRYFRDNSIVKIIQNESTPLGW